MAKEENETYFKVIVKLPSRMNSRTYLKAFVQALGSDLELLSSLSKNIVFDTPSLVKPELIVSRPEIGNL